MGLYSRLGIAGLLAPAWLAAAAAHALPIDPTSPTTDWTILTYSSSTPDAFDDEAGGGGGVDIVGDLSNASAYMLFDDAGTTSVLTDGFIAFRVRIGADTPPAGFSQFLAVGVDGDLDGSLDVFIAVDHKGPDELAIYDSGGTNTTPDNTVVASTGATYTEDASNYDFSAVDAVIDPLATSFDLDGDGNDYFVTFVVPFQDLVDALTANGVSGFDENTLAQFVIATSTTASALNQDFAGPTGGVGSTSTWTTLGAFSDPFAPIQAPEPGSAALMLLGLIGLAVAGRSRDREERSLRRGPRDLRPRPGPSGVEVQARS